jgi:hypothetical protein
MDPLSRRVPDFDSQNVLVDNDGIITGIIEDNMRHDSPTELASYRRAYLDAHTCYAQFTYLDALK